MQKYFLIRISINHYASCTQPPILRYSSQGLVK